MCAKAGSWRGRRTRKVVVTSAGTEVYKNKWSSYRGRRRCTQLSAADKLFVIPPAQTTAIDGLSTDDLSRVLSFCGDPQSRTAGLRRQQKGGHIFPEKLYIYETSYFHRVYTFISDVRPREVKAGDIITVFGRTCVADEWRRPLTRRKIQRFDSDFVTLEARFGLVDMIRVIVGD